MEAAEWQSEKCRGLTAELTKNQTSQKIRELAVLINKVNSGLIMIVGFILNVFFLWTLKYIIAIEKWKRNNQQNLKPPLM